MSLSPEFTLLAFTLLLAMVQIFAAAAARTSELGLKWNAGPRDEAASPPGALSGRLARAQANLFETLPLFAAAVIMVEVAGRSGDLSALGAHLYFFARVVYVPVYAFGVSYARSIIWLISIAGLLLTIAALFV